MRSPLQDTLQGASPRKRRRALPVLIVTGALAALIGASLAASISVNSGDDIEFGQGSATASSCTAGSNISLTTTVDGTGAVTTYSLRITSVNSACFGKYLRASLIGGAGPAVQDQIVWYLEKVGVSDSAMTLSATVGGPTSGDNSTSGGTSTIYPLEGVTNSALKASTASDVSSVQLETSDSAFSASA